MYQFGLVQQVEDLSQIRRPIASVTEGSRSTGNG